MISENNPKIYAALAAIVVAFVSKSILFTLHYWIISSMDF